MYGLPDFPRDDNTLLGSKLTSYFKQIKSLSECTPITFTNLDNSLALSTWNVSDFNKVTIFPGLLIDSKLNSTIPGLIMTEMKS